MNEITLSPLPYADDALEPTISSRTISVGDAVVTVPGMTTPIGPVSNVVDFTIAHLLEIECCRQCVERGIVPPVWNSANAPGGDEKNAAYLAKYKPLVKCL